MSDEEFYIYWSKEDMEKQYWRFRIYIITDLVPWIITRFDLIIWCIYKHDKVIQHWLHVVWISETIHCIYQAEISVVLIQLNMMRKEKYYEFKFYNEIGILGAALN